MEEERRKIQLTGKSTYIVSLPKSWVTKLKLKPGDGVTIQMQTDSSLLVIPGPPPKHERPEEVTVKISPKENPYAIARKVISFYLVGYSVIRLVADEGRISPAQRDVVKQFVRTKLVGAEITTDLPKELTIQVLLSYPELSVKGAFKRMCLLASSMMEDAVGALERLDRGLAQDVIARDDEVDRFGLYVIRLLKSAVENLRLIKEVGLETPRDCLGYRLVTKSVERIADHAVSIARNVVQLKKPVGSTLFKRIKAMSNFSAAMFDKAIDSLFREDPEQAEKVIQNGDLIDRMENRAIRIMLEKVPHKDLVPLRMITESLRRMAEYSCDIAEIVLNLTAKK